MIVAIMQPYFFPYIGYFQLMRAVDVFIFHDDVQYIKGGWVNRNCILVNKRADWLTMPVKKASNYLPINKRHYAIESEVIDKMKRRLASVYAKATSFHEASQAIFELFDYPDTSVSNFNCNALITIARKLGIRCDFATSSELEQPVSGKGQERVIGLCHRFGADRYINPIGGVGLYDFAAFADARIELSFLQTTVPPVSTESGRQHLSVIDGLMRDGFDGYSSLLSEYTLLGQSDLHRSA